MVAGSSSATQQVRRFGVLQPVDEAFLATGSGSLARMLSAMALPTNAVDRHYLLLTIVDQLYRRRKAGPAARRMLIEIARLHLAELAHILPQLALHDLERSKLCKPLPSDAELPVIGSRYIPTFDHLCMALCEVGQYEAALDVWRHAVAVGYASDEGLEKRRALIDKRKRRFEKAAGLEGTAQFVKPFRAE